MSLCSVRFGERVGLRRSSARDWSALQTERRVRSETIVAGHDCPRGEGVEEVEEVRNEGMNCG